MTTVLAFICFCAVCCYSWWSLKKVARHDGVLFPFCQLRRDVMRYRYEAVMDGSLSHKESDSLRRLSRTLGETIRNYNRHKMLMFNVRKVAEYLVRYRHTIKQIRPVDVTDTMEIRRFHMRFVQCLARAYCAYTPLIRSELVLRLAVFVFRRHLGPYVLTVAEQIRNDRHPSGLLEGRAAEA